MTARETRPSLGQPFARGQNSPLQTGPFLGGYLYVLPSAVAAGGTVKILHTMRCPPRVAEVKTTQSATFPSRVSRGANWNASEADIIFEQAQPAGTALHLW